MTENVVRVVVLLGLNGWEKVKGIRWRWTWQRRRRRGIKGSASRWGSVQHRTLAHLTHRCASRSTTTRLTRLRTDYATGVAERQVVSADCFSESLSVNGSSEKRGGD